MGTGPGVILLLAAAARAVTSSVTARVVWLADDLLVLRRCSCGHARELHRHYRTGSDCGACGRDRCPSYRYRPFTTRRS